MKGKMELRLKELKEAKENFLKELQRLENTKNLYTSQVIACNGGIETLEKLLSEEDIKT